MGRGALYLVDSDTEKRLRAIRGSSERAATITGIARSLLPEDAEKALNEIQSDEDRPNVRNPKPFRNDGTGGAVVLPTHDENGQPITYEEHTVNARPPGGELDGKRILIGSDGTVCYTEEHFRATQGIEIDMEFVRDVEPIEP